MTSAVEQALALLDTELSELKQTTISGRQYFANPALKGHWRSAMQARESAIALLKQIAPAAAHKHFWLGIDGSSAFDPKLSDKIGTFIAHWFDSFPTQYHAANPNGEILCYVNFGTAGPGANVLTADKCRANGWLAKKGGKEIPNPWSNDPAYPVVDLGKSGVAQAYINSLNSKIGSTPWNGIFADDINAWSNIGAIDGYNSPQDFWNRAALPLVEVVRDVGIKVIPNVGDLPDSPYCNPIGQRNGIFCEYFLMWGNGQSLLPQQIENLANAIKSSERFFGLVHRDDAQGRKYAFGASSVFGASVSIAVQTAYGSKPLNWDPIFDTDLGPAYGPINHAPGNAIWSRQFQKGLVTINTNTQTCEVT